VKGFNEATIFEVDHQLGKERQRLQR
jgi:hypothetical protein